MIDYTTVRVIWADTDAARVVWFGTYMRYVEMAELAMFDALGSPFAEVLATHHILIPRTTLTCNYRSPARFNDLLDLGLGVETLTERRVRFAFRIRHHVSHEVVADGAYEIACVDDATFKGRPFPDAVHSMFDAARATA
jgi:YbgC/YbaW family acyl-CoA thioester hydrolase